MEIRTVQGRSSYIVFENIINFQYIIPKCCSISLLFEIYSMACRQAHSWHRLRLLTRLGGLMQHCRWYHVPGLRVVVFIIALVMQVSYVCVFSKPPGSWPAQLDSADS
jgi:hypothetical protein